MVQVQQLFGELWNCRVCHMIRNLHSLNGCMGLLSVCLVCFCTFFFFLHLGIYCWRGNSISLWCDDQSADNLTAAASLPQGYWELELIDVFSEGVVTHFKHDNSEGTAPDCTGHWKWIPEDYSWLSHYHCNLDTCVFCCWTGKVVVHCPC